jgi:hypothetical protein
MRSAFIALLLIAITLAHAQACPPAFSGSARYAIGDQVQANGNLYRAIKAVSNGNNPSSDYTDWELNLVRSNTTLTIGAGQTFPTLTSAWNYALNAKVADGAYLHFYISSQNGNYSQQLTAPLLLDHASGARIAILGDNPANDTLSFTANGIIVDTGHSLNTISGLGIYGSNNGSDGIKVDDEASIALLANTKLTLFGNAVHVLQGGSVTINSDVTFPFIETYCGLAETGGSIVARSGLTISGGSTTGSQTGFGAVHGGIVSAENCTFTKIAAAADAYQGGVIDLLGSMINQVPSGILCRGGVIDCRTATFFGCTNGAITADFQGFVDAGQCIFNDNSVSITAIAHGFVNCMQASFANDGTDISVQENSVVDAVGANETITVVDNGTGSFLLS